MEGQPGAVSLDLDQPHEGTRGQRSDWGLTVSDLNKQVLFRSVKKKHVCLCAVLWMLVMLCVLLLFLVARVKLFLSIKPTTSV